MSIDTLNARETRAAERAQAAADRGAWTWHRLWLRLATRMHDLRLRAGGWR